MKTSLLLLVLAAACAPSTDFADSAGAVPAVDTLKAAAVTAADSMAAAKDSAGATTAAKAVTPAPPGTKAARGGTGTRTAPADSTNIGRDRAIQFDPKKPRLPVVDTTKRPPE